MGGQGTDETPAGDVDASLLGGILREKFGSGLSSISDPQLNHTARSSIVRIKPTDFDHGMKLVDNHTVRGWKISWGESKKQPYTPRTRDPYREYTGSKTQCGARGQKHRQKEPTTDVHLIQISEPVDERDAKYQRRRTPPHRAERSMSRRDQPGYCPTSLPERMPGGKRRLSRPSCQAGPPPVLCPATVLVPSASSPPQNCHGAQPIRPPHCGARKPNCTRTRYISATTRITSSLTRPLAPKVDTATTKISPN